MENNEPKIDNEDAIRAFANGPVPLHNTYEAWKVECANLGPSAPGVFLRILQEGSDSGYAQENAIHGLQCFGFSAYEEGDRGTPNFMYVVRRRGEEESTEIRPKIIPRDLFADLMEEERRNYPEEGK